MYQQGFTLLQIATTFQRNIRGQVGGLIRRALGVAHAFGQRFNLRFIHHHGLSKAPITHANNHRVAFFKADTGATRFNIASSFTTWRKGQRRLELVLTLNHQEVWKINGAGF